MRSLLLVESFDLHPSNQYILVRVIPSCFRFAKMCLCQVRLLPKCSPRVLTTASRVSCTLFIWNGGGGGGHVSLHVVNVTWIELDSLAFIRLFLNQFWITSRSVYSFCDAMAGSLSMATTAVSLAKVAVVESGERYNKGPRTLPWGTPALTEDSSVYLVP
jgi:hypothetical protein